MWVKILIIPDIHHKIDIANQIINFEKADQVICLGDLFDDFNDTPDMIEASCDWLNHFVKNSNHIFITGNHDIMYMYNYECFFCSGYTQWKHFMISDLVPQSTWNKLKFHHFMDDWLLSHAGIHSSLIPTELLNISSNKNKFNEKLDKFITNECQKGLKNAAANNASSQFLGAGRGRRGPYKVGGIIWCNWNNEFIPTPNLSQIVGHSPDSSPRWNNDAENSFNLCLDTHLLHYATWDGNELVIKKTSDIYNTKA